MPKSGATVASSTSAPPPSNYEEAIEELEALVEKMEAGQLPLDQLLQSFSRGAELLNFCRSKLEAVQNQVKVVEDGQLKSWNNS